MWEFTGQRDQALQSRWRALDQDERDMYEAIDLSMKEEAQKEWTKAEQRIPEIFDNNYREVSLNQRPDFTKSMTSVSLHVHCFC
jgi:hypothetical protein